MCYNDTEVKYMRQYKFHDNIYELVYNDNCFDLDLISEYVTEYFISFDYIFGDFSGDKVRLKGFYDNHHKQVKKYNNIDFLEKYKKDYCNYGAKTFLLKKVQ